MWIKKNNGEKQQKIKKINTKKTVCGKLCGKLYSEIFM